MTPASNESEDDGFEVHFDESGGHLSLSCQPASFAKFRQFVAGHLTDFPEIKAEKISTIEIIDAGPSIAAQQPSRVNWRLIAFMSFILFVVFALGVGIVQIAGWVISAFSN